MHNKQKYPTTLLQMQEDDDNFDDDAGEDDEDNDDVDGGDDEDDYDWMGMIGCKDRSRKSLPPLPPTSLCHCLLCTRSCCCCAVQLNFETPTSLSHCLLCSTSCSSTLKLFNCGASSLSSFFQIFSDLSSLSSRRK